MYTAAVNAENRRPVLLQMMANHPLAALITLGESGLNASHIPMVHEEDGSAFGVLKGHVSRANDQWKDLTDGVDALAIFSGAEHYISAGWYPGKQEDGRVVPTWNYVVVHASGPLRVIRDEAWLMTHLESLTQQHEASFSPPWTVGDAPVDYIAAMLKAIVGFELPIRKLQGKWKVSQNRNERDRAAVMDGLGSLRTASAEVMKALVEKG